MAVYITPVVFEHARLNANIPKWADVYDTLNHEYISGIVLDDKTFWFEHNIVHDSVKNSVYDTIKQFLTNKGYKYLYQ